VDVLSRRYKILEVKVGRQAAVGTGAKPPANRARAANPPLDSSPLAPPDDALFVSSIAAARQEAQVLFELSRDLVTSLDLSGTLSATKARIQELIPHDSIALYSRSGKQLECEYAEGEGSPLFSTLLIPIGQGLSGWVATNNQAILNGNPAAEASYLNDARLHSTLRSALVIPLESETGVTGVLALYRTGTNAFTKDHLRILQIIAPRLTLALENIRRFRSAESTAGRDYLTDLPNARSLFHHLETSLERAAVAGEGLCVLVCDLDGFKAVNDRFGHLQGNDILRATAETFRSHSRKGDFISRMGGDEFVIVLPQTSRDEAARHASRLREALERRGFEILGEPMLSMSIGLAHYPSEGASAESLLAQADQLMYAEKAARSRQDRSVAGLAHAVHSRQ
jgi:diguanylate cyclase (GGDEF)-like protein